MIVSRAPVRFSLGGGGTDLPSYANVHGGFVVSAAIDKYVFVNANRRFYPTIRLSYSKTETVASVDYVEHRVFREALRLVGIETGIELASMADLPASTGLGSSSTFTVAVLNALHTYKREYVTSASLAEEACRIEQEILGDPVGKQDQYIAAFGGITAFTFHPNGKVDVEPVPVADEVMTELETNLVIMYTGVERAAASVLSMQTAAITKNDDGAVERMHRIKALGYETRRILLSGNLDEYGALLHEHWTNKRSLGSKMSNPNLDEHYDAARAAGAVGGKIMGAGGGGFFMFYVRPRERRKVIDTLRARGLRPLRFRFDLDGARIIANLQRS